MSHEIWQQRQLHELLAERPKNGYSPSEASEWTGSLMLGLGCLGPDGFSPAQLKNAPRNAPKLTDALLSPGDVLISRSNTREAVGFVGIFQDVGAPCIYPDLMMRLKFVDAGEDRFFVRFLQSSMGRRQIEAAACGTSGSMVKLNRAAVEGICIPVPPVPEQRRVAEVLDTLDAAIRKTEQLIAKLKQVKQGLLHDLLTRGIDENGELRDPERHPEQFKTSPLGLIPKHWEFLKLGEVVPRAVYGVSVSLNYGAGIPVLRMNNFKDGEADLSDLKYSSAPEAHDLLLQPGDVLFNRTNSIEHVGRTGIWRGQLKQASFASYLVKLEPDPTRLDKDFLNRWLNWEVTQIRIRAFATPGVHQVNINPTNLQRTTVALPQWIDEQLKITEMLSTCDGQLASERRSLEKLRHLKQGLMEDLLTGRVRVTQLLNETVP